MAESKIGVDLYVALRATWLTHIPDLLAKEDPELLMELLKHAEPSAGISQAEMRKALRINQPRMSKLKDKLVAARWVKVWRPASNPRLLLMCSTSEAQAKRCGAERYVFYVCDDVAAGFSGRAGRHQID